MMLRRSRSSSLRRMVSSEPAEIGIDPAREPDDPRIREAVSAWRAARTARAAAVSGGHDWANAEMAVRFWRDEVRELRAIRDVPRTGDRRQIG